LELSWDAGGEGVYVRGEVDEGGVEEDTRKIYYS
tara:strand:+ start:95 stop:196 length:102 start_codon:yes stop_codon:yes gene_type:complete